MVAIDMTTEERLDSLRLEYDSTGQKICVADENGLFVGTRLGARKIIETGIHEVEAALTAKDAGKAQEELFKLQGSYYSTLHSASLLWRMVHVYGLLHIVGTFAGSYAAAQFALFISGYAGSPPVHILFAGIGGAMLKGVYTTIMRTNEELLRRAWIVSASIGSFVGLFLAVFLYYSFAGGLALFGDNPSADKVNDSTLVWVCLFAGFKWEWALDKIISLSRKIMP